MEEIEGEFAVRMNTVPKYVASSTLVAAAWNNSTVMGEIRMLVHPIAVGTGKRLFEGAGAPVALKLVDTRSFDSGVVALTYHAAA
jgi:dihydrofolate reductase